jgi:hypothetical protein
MTAAKKASKRPVRLKKSDRLLGGRSTVEEQALHMTLAPFDNAVREADRHWGIDVLPELVSPEMAQKYGQALGKLNAAIEAVDQPTVAQYVGVCVRGLKAMHEAAVASGRLPATDECWTVEINGKVYGLLRDDRAWRKVQEQMPGVELISSREMALAIEVYKATEAAKLIGMATQAFPQAEVTRYVVKNDSLEDPIPF